MKVILFDGVCNLCNGSVNWVIDHDKKDVFRFASLQSDFGKKKLKEIGHESGYMDSIVLDDDGKVFTQSDAVIQVAKQIGGIYKMMTVLKIIPKFIRNFFYKVVADNRYRWFGKRESCRVPTPELKSKFPE